MTNGEAGTVLMFWAGAQNKGSRLSVTVIGAEGEVLGRFDADIAVVVGNGMMIEARDQQGFRPPSCFCRRRFKPGVAGS